MRLASRAVSVLAGIILGGVLLAATAPLPAAETPRHPNILRLALAGDPETLDPAGMANAVDILLVPLFYQPLLDVTNGTNLVPCAARSCSNFDQRIFTLQLRPDVMFSNGRAVVAGDYVYALERVLDTNTAAIMQPYFLGIRGAKAFVAGQTNHVAGLRAPAPDTLVIELERGDPTFPYLLASQVAVAVPREEVERLGQTFYIRPVGDGPYLVEKWSRGLRLRLSRNPYYHGPEPQHLDGVDLLIGIDETTGLMMFERGELDIADITGIGIPFPSFRLLSNDPHWRGLIERETLFGTRCLVLNTEIPPLDNVLVRRAINHALDRDRRMHVAQGYYSHAEGAMPPVLPGYNPLLRGYDYNPDKARELLRQSGLALPLHTQLWCSTSEDVRAQCEGFQWDLHQVGIEVELKQATMAEVFEAAGERGRVPMYVSGWFVTIPDPVDMLGTQFDGRAITNANTMNSAFYSNSVVNQLLDQGAAELDFPKRFAVYQQAEELIVRDAPWAFLGHGNLYALRQPWLKGPLMEPLWWYRFDRVWIER
jgi:ABC-type transport system substrate-binding protein